MRDVPPTHSDVLAFDIQRNRDHGLKPYVKYLEACKKIKINNWNDLRKFIALKVCKWMEWSFLTIPIKLFRSLDIDKKTYISAANNSQGCKICPKLSDSRLMPFVYHSIGCYWKNKLRRTSKGNMNHYEPCFLNLFLQVKSAFGKTLHNYN